jgi:hypothetical protein
MPVPVFPDGEYDHSHAWQNASDRVSWERTFATGTEGARRMAQAMITANPATPADEIRLKMTGLPPEAPSDPVKVSPTLEDVLGTRPQPDYGHMYDRAPTDFSGSPAGYSGSSRSSLPGW